MHPNIDPVAFHLGPLSVHWYGIMYLLSFIGVWGLAMLRRGKHSGWSSEQIGDLIFYGALGVIIGGRLGYMLFYDFSTLIHEPWVALKIWQGGMSFHGGLLGVCIAMMIFAWKMEKPLFVVTDFIAPLVPFGLAMGRMGNFINGELWGRETTVPWGMVFPMAGDAPRHPSQLYEFFLEGFVLFIALWFYSARPRAMGSVSAWFLIGYALARITAECFRQPDLQLGFVAYNWLTMGQILSIPMLLAGIFLLFWSKKNAAVPPTHENNFNGRAS